MLVAPKLERLRLDPELFGNISKDVTWWPSSLIDCMLRSALYDSFLTEALLFPLLHILNSFQEDTDIRKIKEKALTLQQTLILVADSQFHKHHHLTAAFVANKYDMLSNVLKGLTVTPAS